MRVLRVRADAPDHEAMREAADLLRAGGLVAFPTETVYGLGANALDASAVERIYEAKGRPALNPIIVHVADIHAARQLSSDWTPIADRLAQAFWPGPLTLVVRKSGTIPDVVTAAHDTVGLRVPAHRVALELLRAAGIPIAAPSANLSTQISPVTAGHVARGLGDRVDLILDGGQTTVGIESTVVDVTGLVPRILRPGMISQNAIARVAGAAELTTAAAQPDAPRSPGLLGKHYAPRARVLLFDETNRADAIAEAREVAESGGRVGAMVFERLPEETLHPIASQQMMTRQPEGYARALYSTLHAMDDMRCDVILIERPPEGGEWTAVIDRLERAAR